MQSAMQPKKKSDKHASKIEDACLFEFYNWNEMLAKEEEKWDSKLFQTFLFFYRKTGFLSIGFNIGILS